MIGKRRDRGPKVALVYDRVNKWGGAERVLSALHEIWPEAPLYTSVYDKRRAPWADCFEVRTSFLQNLPLPRNAHEYYPFLMGLAFESFSFDEYDIVISVTSEFAKAIITKPGTLHICYCLTPTGYLLAGKEQYFSGRSGVFREVSGPIIRYLRWYDRIVARRPDRYIAISQTVQGRIKKYYGQDSEVIYPPVTVNARFKMQNMSPATDFCAKRTNSKCKIQNAEDGFYLVVSRLVPNKRVDIAVEAFNKLGWPLKIVGAGREQERLRKSARGNIEFLGYLTDEELAGYYSSCRAVIVCGEEDFNLVAVEAQSFGKPVVAYGAGGVTETVIPGKTGWFFREQAPVSLIRLMGQICPEKINPEDCRQSAARFSKKRFVKEFREKIERMFRDFQEDQGCQGG